MENIDAICQMRATWMASLSEEQKAAGQAERAAWADEEKKAEKLAELSATFQASDSDSTGALNAAQFEDFMGKLAENLKARGVPAQGTDAVDAEMKEKVFAYYNAQSDSDGVTLQDFLGATKKIREALQAKSA